MTEEQIERRNARANKPVIPRRPYFNAAATRDTIVHFVEGIGDTNPLFSDEEYAKKTKFGRLVAPGCFLYTNQWTTVAGGFSGVHAWYSGGDWEWYRPVLEGTQFDAVIIIRELDIKKGRMAGGRNIYIDYGDVVYLNAETREIIGKERYHNVWADRGESGTAKKEFGKSRVVYSRDDWMKILEMLDREELRGAQPRYWEDVAEGDKVGPMIKGPLSVRDEIAWLMGSGTLFFRAHRLEYDFERKHPGVLEYVKELDEADVPELVHIFDEYAREIGVERAYDYGHQRMSWLCNLFTNWMGDDGFLWKMSGDERAFNQVGDVTLFEGKVVKKYVEGGKCCVDIEAGARNQRNENSMPPRLSTVILPSREHGPAVYPEPTPELVAEIKQAKPLD
ncbi:MAG: MaoC family dehydratase N-terminal domain-containing protein [Chloroflexota bacterium]